MDPRYSIAGLIVGLFIGFSGVGGGSLMTPLLIVLFQVNPLIAVGTDLLYSVPTKILGAVVHQRQKNVDWSIVMLLTAGGLPAAVPALVVLAFARSHLDMHTLEKAIRHSVGFAIFVAAAIIVLMPWLRSRQPENQARLDSLAARLRIVAIGAGTGFIVAITSIGSGAFTLPLLLVFVAWIDARVLVGSDIAFAALLLPVAAAGQWSMHNVNLPVCASLLIGSLPGVYIGSKLSRALPERIVRPALAGVLVLAGSRLI